MKVQKHCPAGASEQQINSYMLNPHRNVCSLSDESITKERVCVCVTPETSIVKPLVVNLLKGKKKKKCWDGFFKLGFY